MEAQVTLEGRRLKQFSRTKSRREYSITIWGELVFNRNRHPNQKIRSGATIYGNPSREITALMALLTLLRMREVGNCEQVLTDSGSGPDL